MSKLIKKLIIGGKNSGKYEYLLSHGYKSEEISDTFDTKIIYKLNNWIKKILLDKKNPMEEIKKILETKTEYIIVCDEVNCGIVPMELQERRYVEAVGRVCCEIAKESYTVERVYCGIVTIIK